MKEYTIFLRQGNAKPYKLDTYKSIEKAKVKLYDIVQTEIERQRPFYVDNDFFDNKYNLGRSLFYISILERDVEEWHKFSQNESTKHNKNKLLYLNNYKKYIV